MPYNRSIVSFPRLVLAPVFEFNCIGAIGSNVTRINIGWHSEIEKMEEQPSSVKERLNSSAGPWSRKAGNQSRYLMKSSCYCKTKKSWWTPMKPNLLDRLYYPPRPPCQNPPPKSRSQDTKEHCQPFTSSPSFSRPLRSLPISSPKRIFANVSELGMIQLNWRVWALY